MTVHLPPSMPPAPSALLSPHESALTRQAGPVEDLASQPVFSDGLMVSVSDGTQRHALTQDAAECRRMAEMALAGSEPAERGMAVPPVARELIEQAVARQEDSLCERLAAAVGTAVQRAKHQFQQSIPGMIEWGVGKLVSESVKHSGLCTNAAAAGELGQRLAPLIGRGAVWISAATAAYFQSWLGKDRLEQPFTDDFNHLLRA